MIFFALALFAGPANAATPVHVGKFESRGLFHSGQKGAPAIVMLPGSGAQGPEERMPAEITADRKEHSVFNQLAEPFADAGCHVLQLGKPGVEFFTTWNAMFYDANLFQSLRWTWRATVS